MKSQRKFATLALFFFSLLSPAATSTMTGGRWTRCQNGLCFVINAEKAGTSRILSTLVFAQNVNFHLQTLKNPERSFSEIRAKTALWKSKENRWIFMRARLNKETATSDYLFDENSMILSKYN